MTKKLKADLILLLQLPFLETMSIKEQIKINQEELDVSFLFNGSLNSLSLKMVQKV
jgi:hypothetical protein